VVAAILVRNTADLAGTLGAVRAQVYEVEEIVIVGGDTDTRRLAGAEGVEWFASVTSLFAGDDTEATHLWFIRSGAQPRADALGAVVDTVSTVDAAVAGSKILDLDDPERLLSVGFATDVFGSPYTGLDPDELDQGQYDVVRDVAAVAGDSLFVRRDLARGLGGPDRHMPPLAAAVDFCQRARLRGGRIIVVPSSEVLAPAPGRRSEPWRQRAGRIRGMIKAYGPVTLVWALPAAFLSGFAQSVVSLMLGRWVFFDWLRAWGWNAAYLASSIGERRRARRGRLVGDEELFRYQVKGSVALRRDTAELSDRIRARLPGEDTVSVEMVGQELRRPSLLVGVAAVLFLVLATRSIWSNGLPAVGFSLPFPGSWSAALGAYAGGWNPAGFGSSEPLQPLIAVTGVLRGLTLNSGRLAEYAAIAGSALLGVWGMVRLLRGWGIKAVPGTLAAVVYVAGPAWQGLASQTAIGAMIAIGALPWVLRLSTARLSATSWARAGRVAAIAVTTGIVALASPVLLVVPLVVLVFWALLNLTDSRAWTAAGFAGIGTLLAVPLLFPWAGAADLRSFLSYGDAFWSTSVIVVAAAAIGAVSVIVSAPGRLALVGAWGGILTAGGALVARSAAFGGGSEVGYAGLAVVSLGLAAIVGAAFESITRADVTGWRRITAGVGVVAAALVLVASTTVVLAGRAGLPGDRFYDAFAFTQARPGDPAASRILVLGAPGDLPGDERLIDGAAYRVVAAPMVELWEANLASEMHIADADLEKVLATVIAGETSRAGEALAEFGIRWIVIMDSETPHAGAWSEAFNGQLDIVALSAGLANETMENEAEDAVRALTDTGTPWPRVEVGYEGTPAGRLIARDTAHSRWGPSPWEQAGAWNEVDAAQGRAGFDPVQGRRNQAIVAVLWMFSLLGIAVAGRRMG
jgi:hypothetical protein